MQDIAALRAEGRGARMMMVGLLPEWASEVIDGSVLKLTDGGGSFVHQLENK